MSFRTVFVAREDEEPVVRRRIGEALRRAGDWQVISVREREVDPAERGLAGNLLSGPRRAD